MIDNTKFKLTHVVLYAKGWYNSSDDIYADLKEILKLDDYTPFTNGDVYSILLNSFNNWNHQSTSLDRVLMGIHPNNCWKVNYFTKGSPWSSTPDDNPDYDIPTAFIYYVMSVLRFLEPEYWTPTQPNYKTQPKPKHITNKKVKEFFKKHKI
jgi:hypothetical protein